MKWDTIIFDLDGTLLNSLEDIKNSADHTMRELGFPQKTSEEIKGAVGNGVVHLISCCLPPAFREDMILLDRAVQTFKGHYVLHSQEQTVPYEGVEGFLDRILAHGSKTAVVSNKPDEAAQKVVRHFFGDRITYITGEREGVSRKPAPDLIYEAMRSLGSSPLDTVYIGDSEVDVLTARNAGLPVILVTWGYRDREMLETLKADHIVDDLDELASLLLSDDTKPAHS